MLKFCLNKNNNEVHHLNIPYLSDELHLSDDLSEISGVFDKSYNINNNDIIGVKTPNVDTYISYKINTEDVLRTGDFTRNETFDIHEVSEVIEFTDGDEEDEIIELSIQELSGESYVPKGKIKYKKFKGYKYFKRYVRMPNGKIFYEKYNNPNIDSSNNQYYKIENRKGEIVFPSNKSMNSNGYFEISGKTINGTTNNSGTSGKTTISAETKFYVDNDIVTYNNEEFTVSNNYTVSSIKDSGKTYNKILVVYDTNGEEINFGKLNEYTNPQYLTRFRINANNNSELKVSKSVRAKEFYYILYKKKKCDFNFINGKWQVIVPDKEEPIIYKDEDVLSYNFTEIFSNYSRSIIIDGIQYEIQKEYRTTLDGNVILLYLSNNIDLPSNKSIFINAITNLDGGKNYPIFKDTRGKYYVNDIDKRIYLSDSFGDKRENYKFTISKYKSYTNSSDECEDKILDEFDVVMTESEYNKYKNGNNFIVSHIDNNGNESKWYIESNKNNNNKIVRYNAYKRGVIIDYSYNSGKTSNLSGGTVTENYKFNSYRFVSINGEDCIANISDNIIKLKDDNCEYYIISHYSKNNYKLSVLQKGNNWLICKPQIDYTSYLFDNDLVSGDNVNLLSKQVNKPYLDIIDELVSNQTIYEIIDDTLGYSNYPTVGYTTPNALTNGYFELYKQVNYFSFPIKFTTQEGINLNQEDIVDKDFYNVEKEKAINKIIDMEKDIYYPVIKKNGVFDNVHKIIFNFHLRTRDLENKWKINEPTFSKQTNWNVIDNYNRTSLSTNEIFSSDLLYFLNFNENDVYYQKSKLANTFIRLLFFDSPDENNQNLLHTSTIFFNENESYMKYVNNIKKTTYKPYNYLNSPYQMYCSVNTEPTNGGNVIDYSRDRLDCSFSISNRSETTTSSEGFYIYMFKEYGYKLRPNSIYMKVELNHAGEGKTLQFFMPTRSGNTITCMSEGENVGELMNLTQNELTEFNKGLPLNKILKSQYIKFDCVYDENTHRYVYYMPERYTKNSQYWNYNTMVFNLWEIKIKDES